MLRVKNCCGKSEFTPVTYKPFTRGTLDLPVFQCKHCTRMYTSEIVNELDRGARWDSKDTYEYLLNKVIRR